MERIKLNKEEQFAIAEYGFAYSSDTLIKIEAFKVLEVMSTLNMITDLKDWKIKVENQDNDIADKIIRVLRDKIPQEQRKEIVKDYQGNYVSPLAEQKGL